MLNPIADDSQDSLTFLAGGGEMGQRMRAMRWERTALGLPAQWPQSLRSAVSICLGSSFQIAIYWGRDLSLVYNDAWSPILGQKHPSALGQPANAVWPEIWDTIGPLFERVFRTGEATRSQDQLLAMHRHGFTEECYFDYTFTPIRDEAGGVGGIFNAVVETTFRVIGERRTRLLRDLGERLANTQTPAEVCLAASEILDRAHLDIPFSLVYLADAVDALATLSLAATSGGIAPGSPAAPLHLRDTDAAIWDLYEVTHGSAQVVDGLATKLGRTLPAGEWPEPCERAVMLPLRAGGHSSGVFIAGVSPRLALDAEYSAFLERVGATLATALARAEALEHERERAHALAEIDRAKTVFLSNVSHELRTPLTLILGPLEELLEDSGARDERSRELLQVARRNCTRLLRLVNALLDFSRIEAGRVQAVYQPVALDQYTLELVSVFRSAIERAGLRLTLECLPSAAPTFVDRQMWETIVVNLVSNALKYTSQGEIRVSLHPVDGAVELRVADTGMGIPESSLARLFERFYRVPNSGGRTHEGTGIGLALVHELVTLHGGMIDVESRIGHGSSFTVKIPTGSAHLPAEQVSATVRSSTEVSAFAHSYVEEVERWSSEDAFVALPQASFQSTRAGSASEVRASVLLVDDNADMRDYVRRLLAPNFAVECAADGEEALTLIQADPPDLILTDVMMPRLDGFGLLKAIRADQRIRELPVILLSARAGEEARIEGLQSGADDYLIKPFSARELHARVSAQLNLARMRRDVASVLRQTEKRLLEADRRKDEFLATLAHELRNPLAPIRQAARIASHPGVSDAQIRWSCDIINRQTLHMAMLLDDLLDLSRITRGRFEVKKAPAELAGIIDAAIETARPLIETRRHTLRVSAPEGTISVVVDALRISQALANLLTNAAKYTDSGGKIDLRVWFDSAALHISVSDTGIGIAEDKLSSVFDMFSQVKSAIDRSEGGLGIGLALVKGVVELHGGQVRAESPGLQKGSTFTIVLPMMISTSSGSRASKAPVRTTPMSQLRVLVVDDQRDGAETLAALISSEGHEVKLAFDAHECLTVADAFRPGVIVLDIGMPQMNGYELAERLRRTSHGAQAVLIAVTGWGQAEDKRRAAEAGFDHHLTKPVSFEDLLGLLRRVSAASSERASTTH